ncbi:hypothetical protein K2173_002620 [Erythroxylum novogranatense]|uniref:CAAX prenyl protease 2/Lysostaphin resistance protein A-like domain-containing protein n=1 Tax=Erythroxylum novogranatense TaxID=1862640 RepID=A0AAV8SWK5_9ROSI|nr:hypothetical protein K2173_002620 [Erythroxylum novogranatense]
MNLLTINCSSAAAHRVSAIQLLWANSNFLSEEPTALCHSHHVLSAKSPSDYKRCVWAFARRKSSKKLRRHEGTPDVVPLEATEKSLKEEHGDFSESSIAEVSDVKSVQQTVNVPSRRAVLQACTVTSGLIAALGLIIRQVSHAASMEGFPIHDCSMEVSFGIEMWHFELIMALVILISSSRYLLLRTWPDFAESTEAANKQVLTSIQPVDYVIVSLFPGVSELQAKCTSSGNAWTLQELLFRGALQPLFGMDWKSVLLVASLFGVLHLGNGRKYSFAVWATFVGLVYGYAALLSSSIVVPMASHAFNNLVGGILWRYTSNSSD